jgi:hypothetical protein
MLKVTILAVALLAIGCHARLPPKEARSRSTSEEPKGSEPVTESISTGRGSSGFALVGSDDSYGPSFTSGSERESIEKAFQDTLNLFGK